MRRWIWAGCAGFFVALLWGHQVCSQEKELAQILEKEVAAHRLSAIKALVYKGYWIFDPSRLPERYRPYARVPAKCATSIVWALKRRWSELPPADRAFFSKVLQRPRLSYRYVSPSGRFKIHYETQGPDAVPAGDANGNGIPDYIEEAGRIFDHCWEVEIDSLGYQSPPPDYGRDGDEIDVYIHNMNAYGFTTMDSSIASTPYDDYTSYIEIDNDFAGEGFYTHGIEALKVTAAHELFHVIQLGYNFRDEDVYFFEMSSVWMEDVVYDEINDYYGVLSDFFDHPDIPFTDSYYGRRQYGLAIWLHFLSKKFSPDLVRTFWENMRPFRSIEAMDRGLLNQGSSFREAFLEFAVWNYFTGSRADTINYYEEGRHYPEITLSKRVSFSSDTSLVDSIYFLASTYIKLTPMISDELCVSLKVSNPYDWSAQVIVGQDGEYTLQSISPQGRGSLGIMRALSEVVLIPINLQVPDNYGEPYGTFRRSSFELELKRGRVPVFSSDAFVQIAPNPFQPGMHQKIILKFSLSKVASVKGYILTPSGQVVRHFWLGRLSDGLHKKELPWDGCDDRGNPIASGIYLFELVGSRTPLLGKFAVIR